MKITRQTFLIWLLTVLLTLVEGCSYMAPGNTDQDLVPVKTIGVLPVTIDQHLESNKKNMESLETGTEVLDGILADYFQGYPDISLISQHELEGVSSADYGTPLALAREAGKQLYYDAILITTVIRYEERNGSDYAVITPASVSFSLKLLAVESGRVIWSGDFDQAQQPLLENILPKARSTGSGFRWLTAAELASAGMHKKLAGCPYLRRN